jgi:SAM-dependent methyltransferase
MFGLEEDTKNKYNDQTVYRPDAITHSLKTTGESFSDCLLRVKYQVLKGLVSGKRVLDLGCADGRHLAEISGDIRSGIGVDFSLPFLQRAEIVCDDKPNIRFVLGDARCIPVESESVDVIYSFATMYHIDDTRAVFQEFRRILVLGGLAVLELGNAQSLATLVSRQYKQFARHSSRRISEHLRLLADSGFDIILWRSFQIAPMWGDKPRWLQPLRSRIVERAMVRILGGRMIDEWLSSLPGIRRFAFRHLVVCRKSDRKGEGTRPVSFSS